MNVFYQDDQVTLLLGDARQGIPALPAQSVHCVVTSPPFWAKRDYGVDGQLGREANLEDFLSTLVAVFREVRRVLRDDGTCWVELGDSALDGGLANAPHRFAEAMRADGWYWRSTVVWAKPAPMPESVSGWKWVQCRVKVKAGWDEKHPHPSNFGGGLGEGHHSSASTGGAFSGSGSV